MLTLGAPDLREQQKRDPDGLIDSTSVNFHATVKKAPTYEGQAVDWAADEARRAVRQRARSESNLPAVEKAAQRSKRPELDFWEHLLGGRAPVKATSSSPPPPSPLSSKRMGEEEAPAPAGVSSVMV